MSDVGYANGQDRVRRRRKRPDRLTAEKRQEIANRVIDLYSATLQNRSDEEAVRIQRYAKYRLWAEEKDWPWENASNLALPDMTEKSLRLQDTLHNAVMSQRPPIGAKALDKTNKDKEARVDRLIDFQFFVEQPGERIIGDLADQFVNDGVFTAFVPWVKERRKVCDLRIYDPIPDGSLPEEYFASLIVVAFPDAALAPSASGWDWTVTEDGEDPIYASFYTRDNGDVEMSAEREVVVYDGPRVIPQSWANVFHPPRAANLQAPGPHNPGGAAFVILRDPDVSVSEIRSLASGRDKIYDLLTVEELKGLGNVAQDETARSAEQVKDDLQGVGQMNDIKGAESHRTLTRLVCFDLYDIDGDGVDEDVVWTVLLETKQLLRARLLTELYPSNPPRRPFAEAALLPIEGRRCGMSLLEIMEGVHDVIKALFDQTVDSGTLKVVPFFFYRPTGGMKPEAMRLWPGEGYPLSDPQKDVHFPQFNMNAEGLQINLITMLQAMAERVTTIGDLNFGRVPAGRSSALRTIGGMSMINAQGEARPERILRRFFMGITEIWAQIHELNQVYLPKDKQYRIVGYKGEDQELFGVVASHDQIKGRYAFDFSANVLNTSKTNLQQSLMTLSQVFVSQIAIQLGITKPEGIYRLFHDIANAWGQDGDKYLSPPTPDAMLPPISAEEAVTAIIDSNMPFGRPSEPGGATEHLQKLLEFAHSENFGLLQQEPGHVELFGKWLIQVKQRADSEMQQQQIAAAAAQFQQQGNAPIQPGAASQQLPLNPQTQPMVASGNELLNEALPGAGGGGNTGAMQ